MINYSILQINTQLDHNHHKFFGRSSELALGLDFPPDKELYKEVFSSSQEKFSPEEIYKLLNENHPADFKGHSLSVSDIIHYPLSWGELNLFCDDFGFCAVDFGSEKKVAQLPEFKPSADRTSDVTHLFYTKNEKIHPLTVKISDILSKNFVGTTYEGEEVRLTPGEVYEALKAFYLFKPKEYEPPVGFMEQIARLIFP